MPLSEQFASEQVKSEAHAVPIRPSKIKASASVISSDDLGAADGPSQAQPLRDERSSRKRKRTESTRLRLRRFKKHYSDEYTQLLNTTINDFGSVEEDDSLQPSQVGSTLWSAEEKEILFSTLARKGRHDIRSIAAAVGTKSEPEVHVYLKLLQDEAAKRDLNADRRSKLMDQSAMDAAVEISPSCDSALDLAAEALSAFQEREDQRREEKRRGWSWLLTSETIKWVNERIKSGDEGAAEISTTFPAANLLRLESFLETSQRFFMNSSDPEGNWRSYDETSDGPNIMYTAFSDFHTLAISFTKRLVQSSLFFATSRLRAESRSGYVPGGHVRRQDVHAALEVLGMKSDSRTFWVGLARRHKLRVYEHLQVKKDSGRHFTYEEVENALSHGEAGDEHRDPTLHTDDIPTTLSHETKPASPLDSDPDSDSENSTYKPAQTSTADDTTSTASSSSSSSTPLPFPKTQPTKPHHRDLSDQERLQDEYMEALDQHASLAEEHKLWNALGEDPEERMGGGQREVGVLGNAPLPPIKGRGDVGDWAGGVEFVAEWEIGLASIQKKGGGVFGGMEGLGGRARSKRGGGVEKDEDGGSSVTSSVGSDGM